jgi:Zn-dependent protease with chaperone function
LDFPDAPSSLPVDRTDPWLWAGYLAVLIAVHLIARLVTWSGIWLTALPGRRARVKHWSEQARLNYPARVLGVKCIVLVLLPLVFVAGRDGRRIELLPPVATVCFLVVSAWTGVLAARIALEPEFSPAMALTPRPRRAAWVVSGVLRGVPILIGFLLYAIVSPAGGIAAWAILITGVLLVAAYLTWAWMFLMRATGLIRPAGDRFVSIVAELGDRMKIKPNAVVEVALPMANALAYPPQKAMGITVAALAVLDDEEVSAIAAHEAGHLSEPRRITAVRLTAPFVAGILVAASAAVRPAIAAAGLGGFLAMVLSPWALLAWVLWYRKIYRRMEKRADSLGKEFEPAPGAYGRALEKLYATNLMPVVMFRPPRGRKKSSTRMYPELYDRMVDAGVTPDYPRPPAPPLWLSRLGMLYVIAASAAGCFAVDQLALAVASW